MPDMTGDMAFHVRFCMGSQKLFPAKNLQNICIKMYEKKAP